MQHMTMYTNGSLSDGKVVGSTIDFVHYRYVLLHTDLGFVSFTLENSSDVTIVNPFNDTLIPVSTSEIT